MFAAPFNGRCAHYVAHAYWKNLEVEEVMMCPVNEKFKFGSMPADCKAGLLAKNYPTFYINNDAALSAFKSLGDFSCVVITSNHAYIRYN